MANPFAALVGSVTSTAEPIAALSIPLNGLAAAVNQSHSPLNGFATSVTGLESHLSGKLKEVRREPMPYDVFLSHAGADKPAVERLAIKLREAGVELFLDKWQLIPGEPWQEALEDALDQSRTCAVFIGKALGPWQNEEMRSALADRVHDHSIRMIPVLLPGGREPSKEELPRFLRLLTWVDFRAGLDDEDAFRRLLAGIRGEAPGPGSGDGGGTPSFPYRCMAPARESFVARREYEEAVQALLAGGSKERVATVGLTTALQGAGGFGKTALATELCYDSRVREQYPDGILWTTLGEEIDAAGRLARVRDLIRWWTEKDPPAFETVSAASADLRRELEGQRVLLVVDDVWSPEDVTPFQGLGQNAALLITSRDSGALPGKSILIRVDAMDASEAIQLLGESLPAGAEEELKKLAAQLGEWPLLLKIVNGQLREWIREDGFSIQQAIQEVQELLAAEGLTAFDRKDLDSRHLAVSQTLAPSLHRLAPDEVELYGRLAVLPEDRDIPLTVLGRLWGLELSAVKVLCNRLYSLSLLRHFDRQLGTVRLHDVIRDHLVRTHRQDLSSIHHRLLKACRPPSGEWADLAKTAAYLWRNLAHHMVGAGERDQLRRLLLTFGFLRSKLEATDINALLADYSHFEKDEELRLVRDALRLSAHALARNPAELLGQLSARLLNRQEAGIRDLLHVSEVSGLRWLRPRQASLNRPGGSLIRTIDHPGHPKALAVFPDGRVISGSEDGALRVWDVENGKVLHILERHSGGINAVAVLGSHRVVSGFSNGTLWMWDVESGKSVLISEGHSGGINALAVLEGGRRLVSASSDGMLLVLDLESGQISQALEGHSDRVLAVAVLKGSRVVSGSSDRTLRVWDLESGRTLQILKGHSDGVYAVSASEDSQWVVSGSSDGTLRLWEVESGQTFRTLQGHSYWVRALAMLDFRHVVSGSFDRTLRLWNVEGDGALQVLKGHSPEVHAVAVLDSRRVVFVSFSGTLWLWDMEGGDSRQVLDRDSAGIYTMAVLDSRHVVSGSYDGTLRLWDLESGQALQILKGHSKRVLAVAMLNGRRVVSGSEDGTLRLWDVETGDALQVLQGHSGWIFAVAALDERRVVFGSEDGTLRLWDVESGEILKVLDKGHSGWILTVAVLDSLHVVSGSDEGMLRVWNIENGQTFRILKGHLDKVNAIGVLDSHRVVSGSDDRTLRVWNVESGKVECLFTLDASVTSIAVIPDSRIIVAGDGSGRIHFFDFVDSESNPEA